MNSVEKGFIVSHLKSSLFLPSDVIIREDEKGDKCFFINEGKVDVTLKSLRDETNHLINKLHGGQLFGEVGVLT